MKKNITFFLIVGIFAYSNSFSQTNCNRTSPFWSNNMNFIPDSNAPSFVMPLNFIIVRKSDGTGNFPNNALTWDIFSDAIDLLNETYNNLVPLNPNDSLEFDSCFNAALGEPDFIPSIKIQFVLGSIYFIDSTAFWGSKWPSLALRTYVESNYSDGFNIYFPIEELAWQCYAVDFNPCAVEGSNYAPFPSATDMNYSQHMAIRNFYAFYLYNRHQCSLETDTTACYQWLINENKKALGRIMSLEFGHTFGLSHTCAHYTFKNQCDYTIMHPPTAARLYRVA